MDKRCVTCKQVQPLEAFNVRRSARDGRQDRCRECCKRWYAENGATHRRQVAARKVRVQAEYRQLIGDFLLAHPCVDCGERDIRVLEFDHRPGLDKVDHVATLAMRQVPLRALLHEMSKCDIRCANCHRKRTVEQRGYWRQRFLLQKIADELAAECRRSA